MKKILLILALFFASVGIFYPAVHPNTAAMVAAASAARRQREELEHKEKYHKGSMSSYSEYIEVWEKDEFKKDIICKYEKIYYYYQIDPKKCIQNTQIEGPINIRYPTEQEIRTKNSIDFLFCITCSFTLAIIITFIILNKSKEKKWN